MHRTKSRGRDNHHSKYFSLAELASLRQVLSFKTFVLVIVFWGVLFTRLSFADVVITEIMYDPPGADTGREWIEVQNTGAGSIDLAKFRLFENGTNHKIGGGSLAAGSFGIIADNPEKFKADWPQYSGPIFDSAFSLNNTGETIELRDASSTVMDSVSYSSAEGGSDGNSLNKDGSGWVSRKPSPGGSTSAEMVPKPVPVQKGKTVAATRSAPVQKPAVENAPLDSLDEQATVPEVAAVATPHEGSDLLWWGALLMLVISSAGAVVFAKRFAKDEWDIIEE